MSKKQRLEMCLLKNKSKRQKRWYCKVKVLDEQGKTLKVKQLFENLDNTEAVKVFKIAVRNFGGKEKNIYEVGNGEKKAKFYSAEI